MNLPQESIYNHEAPKEAEVSHLSATSFIYPRTEVPEIFWHMFPAKRGLAYGFHLTQDWRQQNTIHCRGQSSRSRLAVGYHYQAGSLAAPCVSDACESTRYKVIDG